MRNQAASTTIIRAAVLLTITVAVATAFAALALEVWMGDLAAHFRVQYVVLALASCITLALKRRPLWAVAALGIASINVWAITSTLRHLPVAPTPLPQRAGAAVLRLASINVFYRNRDFERVISFARDERPDIVVLLEVNDPWRRALRALERDYRHSYATRGTSSRGITLLSRWPIETASILPIGEDAEPGIQGTVRVSGRVVRVLAVHARWPMGRENTEARNRQLEQLAALARAGPGPVIVIGDLNLSPFSPHFPKLLQAGRLSTATPPSSWHPTWPLFLPPAGIQIDHALVSRGVAVRRFERGAGVGSDHRPIVVEVVLP